LLVAAITFLFFIGNSFIGRSIQSLRDAYVNSLTGDVVIEKSGDVSMNLFGANVAVIDEFFSIPALPAHDIIARLVAGEKKIEAVTSMVSSRAVMDVPGYRAPILLCGVDAATYFPLFPAIRIMEGRRLEQNEYGLMITAEKARTIEKETGTYPAIGTNFLFTAGGGLGFKIRELPLVGIYQYQNPGRFTDNVALIDDQTARVLSAIRVATSDVEVDGNSISLITTENIDDLFEEGAIAGAIAGEEKIDTGEPVSPDEIASYLAVDRLNAGEPVSGGDWNFIIIRLKKGVAASPFIASLNKKIAPYGAVAINWQTAAGESATMMILLQSLFNGGITLISIVGLIAIINTLSISVLKRRREIGTLRAIGSSAWYIRFLFLGENFALSCSAGLMGVCAGALFFRGVNTLNIVIPNELIASLLGGQVLHIAFFPQSALLSFALAVVLGLLSSVYPVETAVRIQPVAAMRDSK
jgi:ABC-type lipoprotein release transport system permease subunit